MRYLRRRLWEIYYDLSLWWVRTTCSHAEIPFGHYPSYVCKKCGKLRCE